MDWNNARIVLAIHRGGSLTAAGKLLDLDQSTVGRRLAAYEEDMRVRLFERRENRMIPTREGQIVVEHAERMEVEAFALETKVRGRDDRPEGEVVVTSVQPIIDQVLMPNAGAMRERYPSIRLSFVVGNTNLSLERGEADVAVRLARPTDGRALARRIGRVAYRLYAHRDLLRRYGTDDPRQLPWIGYYERNPRYEDIVWMETHYPNVNVAYPVNSATTRATGIRCALGIGIVPSYYVSDMPEVVALSGKDPAVWREMWMLTLPEYRGLARVQPVIDWIVGSVEASAALFAGEPAHRPDTLRLAR
jgi:DNA-binding transcriptional LysR family regulator